MHADCVPPPSPPVGVAVQGAVASRMGGVRSSCMFCTHTQMAAARTNRAQR